MSYVHLLTKAREVVTQHGLKVTWCELKQEVHLDQGVWQYDLLVECEKEGLPPFRVMASYSLGPETLMEVYDYEVLGNKVEEKLLQHLDRALG